MHLVEWVGASSPVSEEQAEADGFEDAGNGADGDGIDWSLLGDDLGDDGWCSASEEDQGSEVCSALVAECASRVDESTDTV